MLLIGLSGKKQSGKDTVAEMIKSLMPEYKYERIAFADALKEEVAKACGVSVDYINKHKDNFRLILQGWGTDFRRKLHGDDYWIQKWLKKCWLSEADIVIVTDVRFINEADCIRQIGGILIRVERDNDRTDIHPSETALDNYKFDAVIYNESSLEALRKNVQQTLIKLSVNL